MIEELLLMRKIPLGPNLGRLALRMAVFIPLFLKHGIEKVFTFSAMAQHFPDPIGIGPVPTLVIAMIGDAICAPLLVIGLGTRWAALYLFCNLTVAWATVHQFAVISRQDQGGETLFIYMAACIALFLLGGGKYSVEGLLQNLREKREAEKVSRRLAEV